MFGRLAWAAAQGCKQLVQSTVTCSASASASCSMAARHATHHSASSTSSSRLNAWHQLSPSQPGSGWRMFTTGPGGAMPRNILENAAELQMQKLKSKAKDVGQEHTMGARIRGVAWDSLWLSVTGFTLFSGYYSFMYRDVSELDSALRDARQSLVAKPADPAAGPGPAAASAAVARKGPPIEPAMLPPVTMAWCAVMERYLRIRKYIEKSLKDYRDPTYDKLLPDMAPELRGRIKTLVLDLDDTLVHKEWTRQTGWKIYKRPGVQDFLLEMGGYYEVVVFTDTPATYAEPIISKLDPHRVVLYRLYRPETQYHNGKHVRDLSKLNRDLSQVLMISSNPDAWEFQPENTIKLRPWQKDTGDTTLLDLIPMLQLIATKGVKDVRDVVRSYDGEEDIPRAFKTRMAQIAGQQKQPKQRGLLSSLGK